MNRFFIKLVALLVTILPSMVFGQDTVQIPLPTTVKIPTASTLDLSALQKTDSSSDLESGLSLMFAKYATEIFPALTRALAQNDGVLKEEDAFNIVANIAGFTSPMRANTLLRKVIEERCLPTAILNYEGLLKAKALMGSERLKYAISAIQRMVPEESDLNVTKLIISQFGTNYKFSPEEMSLLTNLRTNAMASGLNPSAVTELANAIVP